MLLQRRRRMALVRRARRKATRTLSGTSHLPLPVQIFLPYFRTLIHCLAERIIQTDKNLVLAAQALDTLASAAHHYAGPVDH